MNKAKRSPVEARQRRPQKRQADPPAESSTDQLEEHEPLWKVFLGASPSWLTSMLVHMILLLVLALISFHGEIVDNIGELVIKPTEEIPPDELQPTLVPVKPERPTKDPTQESKDDVDDDAPPPSSESFAASVPHPEFEWQPPRDLRVDGGPLDFGETALGGNLFGKPGTGGPGGDGLSNRFSRKRRENPSFDASDLSAVEAALKWLAERQNRDGSWSFAHTPGDRCSGFPDPGQKTSRMGATGLALLPFLGAGYTHVDGKYKKTVKKGLAYLRENMLVKNNAGRLYEKNGESHSHMYCHGIAACAMIEAYGMTNDSWLRSHAQLAVNYIIFAQHPDNGGWLYEPRQGGDTSVAGWQIMALKSAAISKLKISPSVKPLAIRWLDSVQSDMAPGGYGVGSQYGYRTVADRDKAGACTAIGLLCRNYLGTPQDDPGLRMGVRSVAQKGPSVSGRGADMYYNYYASMLMFQNDGPSGDRWKNWNDTMKRFLKDSQVKDGREAGSWHFTGNHGDAGGRVYSTALAAMTLEVWYRYMSVYQQENVQDDSFPIE